MLNHITKYECFLINSITVVDFTSCYILKNFSVPPNKDKFYLNKNKMNKSDESNNKYKNTNKFPNNDE